MVQRQHRAVDRGPVDEPNQHPFEPVFRYDGAGRLTQVPSTPAGTGCTTRIYAYDPDTNRLSLTTREPEPSGKCASEGGTVESHRYDEADRLINPGVTYNAFGDITTLPAPDAGGSELTSSYYDDNQLASMTQHESATQPEAIGYNRDPAGRTRKPSRQATQERRHHLPLRRTRRRALLDHQRVRSRRMDPQHRRDQWSPCSNPEQRRNPSAATRKPTRRHHRHRLPLRNRDRASLQRRHLRVRRPHHNPAAQILLAWSDELPTELPAG